MKIINIGKTLLFLSSIMLFAQCNKGKDEPQSKKYEGIYPQTLLMEQFTSEFCGACPGVDKRLHEIFEKEKRQYAIEWIAYHNAGIDDPWTIKTYNKYLFFWDGKSYNPALMLNRRKDLDHKSTPIINVNKALSISGPHSFLRAYWKPELNSKSPIKFDDIKLLHNKENSYGVEVTGEIDPKYPINSKHEIKITAVITENKLPVKNPNPVMAIPQHDHVARIPLTDITGEVVQFTNHHFNVKIAPKEFNGIPTNARIVLFMHYWDENNLNYNYVLQAGGVQLAN